MKYVSSTEAKQEFATILDKTQSEPIIIRKQNRDFAVMMSMEDYQRITQLNIEEFQKFRETMGRKAQKRGLTEEKLWDILADDE